MQGIEFAKDSHIDLKDSFAPGTYIQLKLEKENDEIMQWAYVECESEKKKEALLNSAYFITVDELKMIGQSKNILSFYLPIKRDNEPKEEMQDYQYYIIVFAYQKEKSMPSLEDPYIVIDMSFRVGVGDDENVRESVLTSNLPSDTDYALLWKKLNLIADFYEAYNFATINSINMSKDNKQKFILNPQHYPQLAGKIAYIFYRFNMGKIYYQIKSKKEMQIKYKNYFKNLNHYENIIIKTLKEFRFNSKYYEVNKMQWWKNLIEKICKKFNLNIQIEIISQKANIYGTYNNKNSTIIINQEHIDKIEQMLKTIIHEIRHAVIHQNKDKSDVLLNYIFYTYEIVYFDKDKIYFGIDKDEARDVYFFQPSEAEAREIEKIIERLK